VKEVCVARGRRSRREAKKGVRRALQKVDQLYWARTPSRSSAVASSSGSVAWDSGEMDGGWDGGECCWLCCCCKLAAESWLPCRRRVILLLLLLRDCSSLTDEDDAEPAILPCLLRPPTLPAAEDAEPGFMRSWLRERTTTAW
jgi:hypothetical protein